MSLLFYLSFRALKIISPFRLWFVSSAAEVYRVCNQPKIVEEERTISGSSNGLVNLIKQMDDKAIFSAGDGVIHEGGYTRGGYT